MRADRVIKESQKNGIHKSARHQSEPRREPCRRNPSNGKSPTIQSGVNKERGLGKEKGIKTMQVSPPEHGKVASIRY